MATISTQFTVVDRMTSTLNNITNSLDVMIGNLNSVDNSINNGFDSGTISKAEQDFQKVNNQVSGIDKNIGLAESEQQKFNSAVEKGTNKMNSLLSSAMKMFGIASVVMAVKNAAVSMYNSATTLEATESKFNTVFKGFEDVAQGIVDKFQILTPATESATRSMVSGIQDLLVPMGFARDEATAMTGDTMNLVGALTNFNSATHSAEDVANAFTSALTGQYTPLKALGVQVSATTVEQEVFRMGLASTTDEITSQMKAQALLSLAYEQSSDALAAYNEESLDTLTRAGLLKTGFSDAFAESGQKFLPQINNMLMVIQANMPTIIAMIDSFGSGLATIIAIASGLLSIIMWIATIIVDNWSIIAPIITGIAVALGIYNGALLANLAITQGATAIKSAFIAVQTFMSIGYGVLTGSTAAASAAQMVYNSALLACPLTWVIMIVIALIAVFYAVIAVINKLAGTTMSATGIICGAFMWLCALIGNSFIGTINAIMQYLYTKFVEPFISIIEWILNVCNGGFDSFGDAVSNLIGNIIGWFLSLGTVVTKIIDAIFGTNWTGGLNDLKSQVTSWGKNDTSITLERNAPQIDYTFDYGDAWDTGYNFGQGIDDSVSNMFSGSDFTSLQNAGNDSLQDYETDLSAAAIQSIATDTSDISSSISATAEELAYLRDLAEQEAVNRFTTAEVKIDMTGMTNKIDSDMDLDGVIAKLSDGFLEALDVSAEGVHA